MTTARRLHGISGYVTRALAFGAIALLGFERIAGAHAPRALPLEIVSQAPGIHPLGHGERKVWGLKIYGATLWVSGRSWSASEPHAVELEPARAISAANLVDAAVDEMRKLSLGDKGRLKVWRTEMQEIVPNVKRGDCFVIFCPASGKTVVYLDGRQTGEVDDATLCPAIMNIWVHPGSSQQELRRALLKQKSVPLLSGHNTGGKG
jgi:hypothetical protein